MHKESRVRAEEWATRYSDVRCDHCGGELEPVLDVVRVDENGWDHLIPDGALKLQLLTSYGSYFDGPRAGTRSILFCKDCADKLIDEYPALGVAIAEVDYGYMQLAQDEESAELIYQTGSGEEVEANGLSLIAEDDPALD